MSDLYKFAYYKVDKKPWTQEEINNLRNTHGQKSNVTIPERYFKHKYVYAYNLAIDPDLYPWTMQRPTTKPQNYLEIPYCSNEYDYLLAIEDWINK